MAETILQSEVLTRFVYPFLLVFFIVFAILEKTKLLGEGKKQINALVAFVIGLIFVSVASPTLIVGNMMLFLAIALVIVFVILIIWGFVSGGGDMLDLSKAKPWFKWVVGVIVVLAVVIAIFWAAGIDTGFFAKLFNSSWSEKFWSNFFFIVLIAAALAIAIKSGAKAAS